MFAMRDKIKVAAELGLLFALKMHLHSSEGQLSIISSLGTESVRLNVIGRNNRTNWLCLYV